MAEAVDLEGDAAVRAMRVQSGVDLVLVALDGSRVEIDVLRETSRAPEHALPQRRRGKVSYC
jgi:hypothetical protein